MLSESVQESVVRELYNSLAIAFNIVILKEAYLASFLLRKRGKRLPCLHEQKFAVCKSMERDSAEWSCAFSTCFRQGLPARDWACPSGDFCTSPCKTITLYFWKMYSVLGDSSTLRWGFTA